jgi:D-threonate/D-erythronate kinase
VRQEGEGWCELAVDPAAELRRRGVRVGRQGEGGSPPILICDAADDRDLAALVDTLMPASGRMLWCGSAGLARALAGAPPVAAGPPGEPHLVVVGSDHAVSRGQVDRVRRTRDACVLHYDEDSETGITRFGRVLADHGRAVALADLPPGMTTADAAERIARRLAALLPRLRPPATLTVVGGETFAAVCRALGATVLAVEGEWQPGIPASRMVDGMWANTRCLSKSGAFGGETLLLDLLGFGASAAA